MQTLPGAFLACAIWVDDLVAQRLALDEMRDATSTFHDRSCSLVAELDLAPLTAALRMRAAVTRLVLKWAMAAHGQSTQCWRTCVDAVLPGVQTAVPSAHACTAVDEITRTIRHVPVQALTALLERWCSCTNTGPLVDALPRALRAKVQELATLSTILSPNDMARARGLAEEAARLFKTMATCSRSLADLPFSALVCFDDANSPCKGSAGDAWTATVNALNFVRKPPVALAFQIASEHQSVNAHSWYKSTQFDVNSLCHCDDESTGIRSAEFTKIVRDLNHAGLVKNATKRGSFMTTNN